MSSTVNLGERPPGEIEIHGTASETLQRFRDVREDERRRLGYEVTNEDLLDMLLDVFALHREDR